MMKRNNIYKFHPLPLLTKRNERFLLLLFLVVVVLILVISRRSLSLIPPSSPPPHNLFASSPLHLCPDAPFSSYYSFAVFTITTTTLPLTPIPIQTRKTDCSLTRRTDTHFSIFIFYNAVFWPLSLSLGWGYLSRSSRSFVRLAVCSLWCDVLMILRVWYFHSVMHVWGGGVWEEKRISRGVGVGESESENEFTDIDGVRVYLFIYSCGTVGHKRGVLVFEWTVKF